MQSANVRAGQAQYQVIAADLAGAVERGAGDARGRAAGGRQYAGPGVLGARRRCNRRPRGIKRGWRRSTRSRKRSGC